MATVYTPKLNLKKPDGTDTASIADINSNMDKIDTAMPVITYSNDAPENPNTGDIWLKPIS